MNRRVYFIRPIGMQGPIKIGCSCAPDRRRETLEKWSPWALEIIAELDGNVNLERRFHAQFAESHEHHEWFTWSPELAEVIDSVKAGAFNPATLPEPQDVRFGSERGGRPRKTWTAAHRFAFAYNERMRRFSERGMAELPRLPYVELSPERIAEAEALADAMTVRHGHRGMRPIRWSTSVDRTQTKAKARQNRGFAKRPLTTLCGGAA